ncbi:DUF3006 domain-containing protein [Allofustis seminis]|uniref:DUF3006 domain-containing protein n=1 Tax=Allofustis seminis TaxID=166939 RepID=UPI00037110C3|nr:DUF3006 domain-containing protein [Allofustis seminis]
MIYAIFEEVEGAIATCVTDGGQVIYIAADKLPDTLQPGDVLEIFPTDEGWHVGEILTEETQKRLEKSRRVREQLKKRSE